MLLKLLDAAIEKEKTENYTAIDYKLFNTTSILTDKFIVHPHTSYSLCYACRFEKKNAFKKNKISIV